MHEINPFGSRTYVFTPKDDPDEISRVLDELWAKQESAQFDDERYAVYFMPGTYDESITLRIGFYTQVAGLGKKPSDTKLSSLKVDARWLADDPSNHNATCNFWRGIENIEIDGDAMWAVSQATFMRRVDVEGSLYLHDDYGWASGGFIADTHVRNMIDSGSQQQWLTRNSSFGVWMGENWNLVFMGDAEGCDPKDTWPGKPYTSIKTTPVIAEKPYLCYDELSGYYVVILGLIKDAVGTTWEAVDAAREAGQTDDHVSADRSIPLTDFYIADPDRDSAWSINKALEKGMNILFTPGIYKLNDVLKVDKSGTVLLGMGLATLRAMDGNACIETADEDGIIIAGLLFDAGPKESRYLLKVGSTDKGHADDPIRLYDLFFRVGGIEEYIAKTDACVILNSHDIIGDNFWVWRADHGDNVAWDMNTARNGIVINGDRNSLYALMVEHFREYQTIWNGNEGLCVMYQSEMPYDVPSQEEWMSHDGTVNGYASFKVADEVETFTGIGIGIYSYHRDTEVEAYSAMEVPAAKEVKFHNICDVMLSGHPGITHIVNDSGDAVVTGGSRALITDYADGKEIR